MTDPTTSPTVPVPPVSRPPVPLPPTPPPSLSPGGRTAVRTGLVIVAVLMMLGGFGGLTVAAVGIGSTRVIAESQPLPAVMRSLTIDTGALPVAVRITADPDVREPRVDLRMITINPDDQRVLDIDSGTDTHITMRGQRPERLDWDRAGELTVVLPPELGRRLTLTTAQRLGLLKVDADLDRLVARTTDGAVVLRGAATSIDVDIEDGSLTAHDPILVRESFSANIIDGDIAVDFRDTAPRKVDATTGNGDVVLGLPRVGPYLVNASSGDSDNSTVISVPQTTDAVAAKSVISARSADGDVVIEELD
jgi:hypothetical protein